MQLLCSVQVDVEHLAPLVLHMLLAVAADQARHSSRLYELQAASHAAHAHEVPQLELLHHDHDIPLAVLLPPLVHCDVAETLQVVAAKRVTEPLELLQLVLVYLELV